MDSNPPATAKQRLDRQNARDPSAPFVPICLHTSRTECGLHLRPGERCDRAHFEPIILPQTDRKLGDCSYLNTCHHLDTCRYLHWQLEEPTPRNSVKIEREEFGESGKREKNRLPPQYINGDCRTIDPEVMGKFEIVLADPPWDIHQNLPYGTMTDDDMRAMPIPQLQDDGGLLFLWVTGRAMDVARDLLVHWGYERVDEIVWVKTNQLQRLIRTGRTGHWLNHTKEHCLVAIRRTDPSQPARFPSWAKRGIDGDVIVSEVRETSRKPDELYEIIERLCPDGRKIEFFGRWHNLREGWITCGNQLEGMNIVEEEVVKRWNRKWPDRPIRANQSSAVGPPKAR
ncbi:MT-A70-domain-containing protein [Atractiella rhizophila]|nr:MT-A70-domain-containing protein [Atractiella rhizophila]